ncbi:PHP domain-containing protein [Nonomuraea candida]|uniref:PHP domain-containing protein n=1 Tax=Nonomuraea candida TaxID=359159 RepID=UPI0005BE5CBA|nr:PHP domain-containing protein [Nonomuraea candida]
MTLPPDGHVHSEWSWDAPLGAMERSCARAAELGLPSIAFTEHVDHTAWTVTPGSLDGDGHLAGLVTPEGRLTPPAFDAAGYLAAIDRCRERFPGLRILSGMEVGEPHWHAEAVAGLLGAGRFDRVLGSLHCLPLRSGDGLGEPLRAGDGLGEPLRAGDGFAEPPEHYGRRAAAEVVRHYLAEVVTLVTESAAFAVLAHIDYPIRSWPVRTAGPFDPRAFEEEFRHALRATARSGRALEINTRLPLDPLLLRWWHEEGGDAVAFGSDAHEPSKIAHGLREAAAMARAHGFRPGADPYDLWSRAG